MHSKRQCEVEIPFLPISKCLTCSFETKQYAGLCFSTLFSVIKQNSMLLLIIHQAERKKDNSYINTHA